jgi:hypothetical protein
MAASFAGSSRRSPWRFMGLVVKVLPYVVVFAVGVVIAVIFLSRRRAGGGADWERKYRDILQRYRDLTGRLAEFDKESDFRANRLRRTLWDVRGMLVNPRGMSPDSANTAVREIDTALKETATTEKAG